MNIMQPFDELKRDFGECNPSISIRSVHDTMELCEVTIELSGVIRGEFTFTAMYLDSAIHTACNTMRDAMTKAYDKVYPKRVQRTYKDVGDGN